MNVVNAFIATIEDADGGGAAGLPHDTQERLWDVLKSRQ